MKELIKLIDINQEYKGEKILTNINLSFNQLQNTVIYSDDNEINSCHLLLDIIAKSILPQKGKVEYFDDKSSQFFIGYNLFDSILEKDVIVLNVIKALTTNHNIAKKEPDELLKILTIDTFITKSAIELNAFEKQLLNLYLLLLIKPQIILLKSLILPGSEMMQFATFGYIKNYLSKYKITLIVTTNDKNTINNICERAINLSKTIIQSDVLIIQSNKLLNNETNVKSKPYDFAENLLDSIYQLEEKNINSDEARVEEKQFVEKLLTKSLVEEKKDNYMPTNALDAELESIIIEKRNNQQSEIQNNSDIQANITKTVKLMSNDEMNVEQIEDWYHQRRDLEEQYNSPNFANLSLDLQSKVYESHARVNNLIAKYDPTNKYDPFYKPSLDKKLEEERIQKPVHANNISITKMIFDENLDIDSLDINDDKFITTNKTKQVSVNQGYENVKTKVYNTDELTKKISSAGDIEYMPNDEENKKRFWFKKKPSEPTIKYVNRGINDNMTNEFLMNSKKCGPSRVVKTEKFEPTKKLLNIEPTDFNDSSLPTSIPASEEERKKQLIELKIKKRSKLNALEELYYEALEEKEKLLKTNKY